MEAACLCDVAVDESGRLESIDTSRDISCGATNRVLGLPETSKAVIVEVDRS